MGDSAPFSIAAVRCPRERGEELAEMLISCGLVPWRAKSRTLASRCESVAERNDRVEQFIMELNSRGFDWAVTFGWERISVDACAAAVCTLSKKTITRASNTFDGDVVLIPDGTADTYGKHQAYLRVQASTFFGGSFRSNFGSVYVSGLPKADLTYPEVMAADFISGYVRKQTENEEFERIMELQGCVGWFDENWREPDTEPVPFYAIGSLNADYGEIERTRIVSWIKGRRPDGTDYDGSNQYSKTVDYLESTTVKEYLRGFQLRE